MGKRQRKKSHASAAPRKTQTHGIAPGGGGQQKSAAASGSVSQRSRPQPPWGDFPLSELVVLVALVLGVAGFFNLAGRGPVLIALAVVLGSLAGLELALREHLSGFRSHAAVLAGCASALAVAAAVLLLGASVAARAVAVGSGACVFAVCFWFFRSAFKRRRARVRVR